MFNDVQNELKKNFIEYAVAVNTDRSIPSATDGLKPVARRILWSAHESGYTYSKPHVKSARIVGNTMGQYHPHGDSSIYGAMVRLSQNWVLRYPLIDWHGSNGTQSGDGPAASRYTEARLSKISEDGLLANIKKKNVNFKPNYDETLEEPVDLPSIFPNLLCNPNSGIGVAIATSWLPHNLTEVSEAIKMYLKGEEPTLPGPDFPTGGIVINARDIPKIMATGHGSVRLRGRYKVEKNNIVFYEIPYGVSIEKIMNEIGAVCDKKEIEGVSDVRDETNKKGVRVVIECKKTADPDYIAKLLFEKTSLQTSISYNQVALVGKTPTELNLKQCIEIYINHNTSCIKREAEFDLAKAKARQEILEGLLRALEDIDNIIALIKKSKSSADAKDNLISQYNFTENQAKAIVGMRLGSLANLEKIALNDEYKALLSSIENLNILINNKDKQIEELITRLDAIVKKYGDARRTELLDIEEPTTKGKKTTKPKPAPVPCMVVLTETGNIKRIPTSSYKVQHRGGKGVKSQEDITKITIRTNTVDSLLVFSSLGKLYKIEVNDIPEGTNTARGTSLAMLVGMDFNEKVATIYSLSDDSNFEYVLFITKNGVLKKSLLSEYTSTRRKKGIAATKIKDNDELIAVTLLNDEDIILLTKNGIGIRIPSSEVRPMGKLTIGVRGIELAKDDYVVSALIVRDNNDKLAIANENGYGYKCKEEMRQQSRGGKGLRYSDSKIAGAAMVSDDDILLFSCAKNNIVIPAKELPTLDRGSKGNKLVDGGNIKSVSKI